MRRVVQGDRRRPKDHYTPAQERILHALAAAEKPCTAADLTDKGLIGPTVLTLGCLMSKQLVSSQVVRRSDSERPIPVYVLTDKGKDAVARLVAPGRGNQQMAARAPLERNAR